MMSEARTAPLSCSVCPRRRDACFRCVSCKGILLCRPHAELHADEPLIASEHSLESITSVGTTLPVSIPSLFETPSSPLASPQCPKHKKTEMLLFCRKCDVLLCHACVDDHDGHQLVTTSKIMMERFRTLPSIVARAEATLPAMYAKLGELHALQEKAQQRGTGITATLEDHFLQLRNVLAAREALLNEAVNEEVSAYIADVARRHETLAKLAEDMKSALQVCKMLGTGGEVLQTSAACSKLMSALTSITALLTSLPPLDMSHIPLGLAISENIEVETARLSRVLNVTRWGFPVLPSQFLSCPLGADCPAIELCKLRHPIYAAPLRDVVTQDKLVCEQREKEAMIQLRELGESGDSAALWTLHEYQKINVGTKVPLQVVEAALRRDAESRSDNAAQRLVFAEFAHRYKVSAAVLGPVAREPVVAQYIARAGIPFCSPDESAQIPSLSDALEGGLLGAVSKSASVHPLVLEAALRARVRDVIIRKASETQNAVDFTGLFDTLSAASLLELHRHLLRNDCGPAAMLALQKAAELSYPAAVRMQAQYMCRGLQGRGGNVLVEANRWQGMLDMETAADLGDAIAQRELGQELLLTGGNKAVLYLTRAAEQADPAAQFLLGMHLQKTGEKGEAVKWLEKAAKQGDEPAKRQLAAVLASVPKLLAHTKERGAQKRKPAAGALKSEDINTASSSSSVDKPKSAGKRKSHS